MTIVTKCVCVCVWVGPSFAVGGRRILAVEILKLFPTVPEIYGHKKVMFFTIDEVHAHLMCMKKLCAWPSLIYTGSLLRKELLSELGAAEF